MKYLRDRGHSVAILVGGMDRKERKEIMEMFRNNKISILVSTSLIARGIDLRNVCLVINADLPKKYLKNVPDYHTYLHRIGRTGRFGDVGIALNLVS